MPEVDYFALSDGNVHFLLLPQSLYAQSVHLQKVLPAQFVPGPEVDYFALSVVNVHFLLLLQSLYAQSVHLQKVLPAQFVPGPEVDYFALSVVNVHFLLLLQALYAQSVLPVPLHLPPLVFVPEQSLENSPARALLLQSLQQYVPFQFLYLHLFSQYALGFHGFCFLYVHPHCVFFLHFHNVIGQLLLVQPSVHLSLVDQRQVAVVAYFLHDVRLFDPLNL